LFDPFPGIFGIFARNLVAKSGSKSDSFELLDSRGCPTDAAIFPAMQKLGPKSKSLVAPFEAFKFTADSVVRFQVNIQFCLPECLPVSQSFFSTTVNFIIIIIIFGMDDDHRV
jgi:hypothetical protein